jgi:hypothetical protein
MGKLRWFAGWMYLERVLNNVESDGVATTLRSML